MTEDKGAVYETIDSLQLQGEYKEIMAVIKYAVAAINNDFPGADMKVTLNSEYRSELCPSEESDVAETP